MATISELIIAVGADPTRLRSGLNKSNDMIAAFARGATKDLDLFGGLDTKATRAANKAVAAMQTAFANKIVSARQKLETGAINIHQFELLGRQAAEAYNANLNQQLDKMKLDKTSNPQIRAALVSQFKDTGVLASQAFERSLLIGFRQVGMALRRVGKEMTASFTLPMLAAGGVGLRAADQFNRGLANIASLIPGQTEKIQELRTSILNMSKDSGKALGDLSTGVYQLVSAFGAASPLAEELNIAVRAAQGGAAQTADAILLLSAVTKGYGDVSLESQRHVSDLAARTVALGQTTFPELAQNIGQVTPLAKVLNVSMEELFGTFATAAGVTGNTSEVATQFRGVLKSLTDPTKTMAQLLKQMGFENGAAAVKALGLQKVLAGVTENAKVSKRPLADYISEIEGQTLAMALAGPQAKSLASNIQELTNSSGAAEAAYRAQTEGVGKTAHTFDQAKAAAVALAVQIGDSLAPTFISLLNAAKPVLSFLTGLAEGFSHLPSGIQDSIIGFVAIGIALGPLITVFGTLVTTFSAVGRAAVFLKNLEISFTTLRVAILGANAAVFLVPIAIAAAIIALIALRNPIDELGKKLDEFFLGIAEKARKIPIIGNNIAENLKTLFMVDTPAAKQGESAGQTFVDSLGRSIKSSIGKVGTIVNDALSGGVTPPPGSNKPIIDPLAAGKDPFAALRKEAEGLTKRLEYMNTLPGTIPEKFARVIPVLRQIQAETDKVNRMIAAAGGAEKAPGALLAIQQGLIQDIGTKAFDGIKASVDQVIAGMQNAFHEGEDLTAGMVRYALAADQAREVYDAINKLMDANNGKLRKNTVLLELQARLAKAIPPSNLGGVQHIPQELTPATPAEAEFSRQTQAFLDAALDYRDAQVQFELVSQSGTNKQIAQAQRNLDVYRKALITVRADFSRAILNQPAVLQPGLQKYLKDTLAGFGIQLDANVNKTSKWQVALNVIGRSAVGLANVARGIGLIGEQAEQGIQGIVSMVDSITALGHVTDALGNVDTAKLASGVVGAIGAGMSILGALFHGDTEGNQIRKTNNDRLAELNRTMLSYNSSIGNTIRVQTSVARLLSDRGFVTAIGNNRGVFGNAFDDTITKKLAQFGLTLDQVEQIAKANGIELLDKNGKVVAGTFQQLEKALEPAIYNLTHFANTLEDQQARIDLHNKVFGIQQTPDQIFQDQMALLQKFAPSIARMLQGLDASTAAGREAIRKVFQTIVTNLEAGKIKPEMFGGLENWQQLAQIIGTVVDGFDQLSQATLDMLNVPNGFKIAAAEFQASIAGFGPNSQITPIVPPPPITPNIETGLLDLRPPKRDANGNLINYYQISIPPGGVVVNASEGQNGDQLADQVVQGIRTKARRQSGDTIDVGSSVL